MTTDFDIEDFTRLPVDSRTPPSTWSRIGDPRFDPCPKCWEIRLECECTFHVTVGGTTDFEEYLR